MVVGGASEVPGWGGALELAVGIRRGEGALLWNAEYLSLKSLSLARGILIKLN